MTDAHEPDHDAAFVLAEDLLDAVLGAVALGRRAEALAGAASAAPTPQVPPTDVLHALLGLASLSRTLERAIADLAPAPTGPRARASAREDLLR